MPFWRSVRPNVTANLFHAVRSTAHILRLLIQHCTLHAVCNSDWEAGWQQQSHLAYKYQAATVPAGMECTSVEYRCSKSRDGSHVLVYQRGRFGNSCPHIGQVQYYVQLTTASAATSGPSAETPPGSGPGADGAGSSSSGRSNSTAINTAAAATVAATGLADLAIVKYYQLRTVKQSSVHPHIAEVAAQACMNEFKGNGSLWAIPVQHIHAPMHIHLRDEQGGRLTFVPTGPRGRFAECWIEVRMRQACCNSRMVMLSRLDVVIVGHN